MAYPDQKPISQRIVVQCNLNFMRCCGHGAVQHESGVRCLQAWRCSIALIHPSDAALSKKRIESANRRLARSPSLDLQPVFLKFSANFG
jgi:hypothetical protein